MPLHNRDRFQESLIAYSRRVPENLGPCWMEEDLHLLNMYKLKGKYTCKMDFGFVM